MADTKISALTAVVTPALTDEFAVNQSATSKKATLAQILNTHCLLISGNSGTANQIAAPCETWQVLTSNAASNSTTTIATVMTTSSLPAGRYWYRYDIITQSAATTTSQKFSVNATGTVTKALYHLFFPSQGVTAATGIVDQDINVTTGAVWAHLSTRTNNTTLGPTTDVDTLNANVNYVIEGFVETSTSGNLLLGHASEVAAASTVQSGTSLRLYRFS
jgi:hypothetical protein